MWKAGSVSSSQACCLGQSRSFLGSAFGSASIISLYFSPGSLRQFSLAPISLSICSVSRFKESNRCFASGPRRCSTTLIYFSPLKRSGLTPELSRRAYNAEAIQVDDERLANSRSARMTCSAAVKAYLVVFSLDEVPLGSYKGQRHKLKATMKYAWEAMSPVHNAVLNPSLL